MQRLTQERREEFRGYNGTATREVGREKKDVEVFKLKENL